MSRPFLTPLRGATIALWALLVLALAGWMLRSELGTARAAFETESRIAHRLLTQRAEQHDALLASLVALQRSMPQAPPELWASFARLVAAAYPQIVAIERLVPGEGVTTLMGAPLPGLAEAVARRVSERVPGSRLASGRVTDPGLAPERGAGPGLVPERAPTPGLVPERTAALDLAPAADGSFRLMRATPDGVIFALRIAPQRLLAGSEVEALPLTLSSADARVLWRVPASADAGTMTRHAFAALSFEKPLGSRSQPFIVRTEAPALAGPLPWARFGFLALLLALLCGAGAWAIEQRRARALAQRQLAMAHSMRVNTLGEIASGMAHELNQPLTAILATAQALAHLLADDPPELATVRGAAATLAQQAQRAGTILHRLREFIAPQTGPAREAGPVDLNRVVQDALALVAETLRERGVRVRSELESGLPAVRCEAIAFEQVVVNLLLNAADALQGQPAARREITLMTAVQSGNVLLQVSDRGDGIAPEVLARVFEPFFTTKPHRDGSGLGLGLTVCEAIVQQAGGAIAAANVEGGARFTVRLPALAA